MAKAPRKIDEGVSRFDCDCGRIHIFTLEEGGKIKCETMEQYKKGENADTVNTDTTDGKDGKNGKDGKKKSGFLGSLGL